MRARADARGMTTFSLPQDACWMAVYSHWHGQYVLVCKRFEITLVVSCDPERDGDCRERATQLCDTLNRLYS